MPQDATVYHHVPGFWQTHRIILVVSEVMGVPLVIIRFRLGFSHGNQPSSERPGSQGTPMTMETFIYSYNSFHLFSIDVPKKSSINHRYPTYFSGWWWCCIPLRASASRSHRQVPYTGAQCLDSRWRGTTPCGGRCRINRYYFSLWKNYPLAI